MICHNVLTHILQSQAVDKPHGRSPVAEPVHPQQDSLLHDLKSMVIGGKNALVEAGSGYVYGVPKGESCWLFK